jgi:hypothetical protein
LECGAAVDGESGGRAMIVWWWREKRGGDELLLVEGDGSWPTGMIGGGVRSATRFW